MSQTTQAETQAIATPKAEQPKETEKVLCPHCLRTATNGLKCKGICVADDDY